MTDAEYTPPKVWTWNKESGGRCANNTRPIAGATHDAELPIRKHPFQLYLAGDFERDEGDDHVRGSCWRRGTWRRAMTPGCSGSTAAGFGSGFVGVNPNSKIPALMDRSGPAPIRVFESGAILVHLAEKFGQFLPASGKSAGRDALVKLFWQVGSAPYLGGGFGHFYAYAPMKIEYAIDRFAMEVKRQLDVLDRRLAESPFLGGDDYSVADMAVWPWYGAMAKGLLYGGGEFLSVEEYANVRRWTDGIAERPGVKRGMMVNRAWGDPAGQLHERHDASDFETKTQDKLAPAAE